MLRPIHRVFALPAGLLAIVALCLLASPPSVAAAQHEVQIADSAFSPGNLVIQVGASVTWSNADDRPHTVSAADGSFDSGNVDEGGSFSFTFTQPGTYSYFCQYHPDMQASIVVEAAPEAPVEHGGDDQHAGAGGQAGNDARSGGASTPSGDQPDTALPAPAAIPGLSLVLWGLALIVLALTVLPSLRPAASTADRPRGGWRR